MNLADCSSAGPEPKKGKTGTAAQVPDPPHKKEAPVEEDTLPIEEIRASVLKRLEELMEMKVGDDTLRAAITKGVALDHKIRQYKKVFALVELINEAYGNQPDAINGDKEALDRKLAEYGLELKPKEK